MSQSTALKFIFFGEDIFSLVILKSLVESNLNLKPICVVMLEPIALSGQRLVDYCAEQSIPLLKTKSVKSNEFLANFDELKFDLTISAHFQRILPEVLFGRAASGGLNLHPSLLPRYRGMSPQHWPIILGDDQTGVTVHLIDEGVDTGNILCQETISLSNDIYIHELQKKFLVIYKTIMVDAVKKLMLGERGYTQPAIDLPYFGKIKEEDMVISSDMGVDKAYGMIRAFSFPYQGACFENLRIMKAARIGNDIIAEIKMSTAAVGLYEDEKSKYLILQDGVLEILKWKKI
jgi:methionyl-tRNA formyltransferase